MDIPTFLNWAANNPFVFVAILVFIYFVLRLIFN